MKNTETIKPFRPPETHWAVLLTLIVVDGGVMSYGVIAASFGLLNKESALSMVFMIIPMTLIMTVAMHFILKKINSRMERLTTAIQRVAAGDLDTKISLEDAGEYREIYEGFNSMVRELGKTKDEMTQFTNDFAHEFKTPITSIKGFSDYLYETGKGTENEERLQYLQVISQQAGRLADLASSTLVLSKAEACQVVTEKTRFELGEQIRRCAILFIRDMEKKKITFEMPEDFELYYEGNEEQLEQVWINLLKNALKFTPEGGTIRVSCRTEEKPKDLKSPACVRISVTDSGVGMDEETKRHIFDKYYQNDDLHFTRGNGIGLAIVKRISELYQGNVSVESVPGKGSTFTVSLPIYQNGRADYAS